MSENVKTVISRLNEAFEAARKSDTAESFSNLVASFTRADKELREEFQRMTRPEVSRIIAKLEAGQSLSNLEIDMVKLWIVGDHESYVRNENNFKDWMSDASRIMGEIEELGKSGGDSKSIMHLRSLFLDAKRSCMDIAHFLERKECVARFEEATAQLDREERETLVKMLKFSMSSDLS